MSAEQLTSRAPKEEGNIKRRSVYGSVVTDNDAPLRAVVGKPMMPGRRVSGDRLGWERGLRKAKRAKRQSNLVLWLSLVVVMAVVCFSIFTLNKYSAPQS